MKKNILSLFILAVFMLITTGCTKYTYDIEIDKKNTASFTELAGVNAHVFKLLIQDFDNIFNIDYKQVEKEAKAKGFEVTPYEDENFKGVIKTKKNIKISQLNNSVLPAGFTTEGRAPVYIEKNCLKVKYIISLKYNIYDAKDVHKALIKKYRTNESTIDELKERLNALSAQKEDVSDQEGDSVVANEPAEQNNAISNAENVNPEAQAQKAEEEQAEKEKQIAQLEKFLNPEVKLRVKIPKKAKKHNATEVLNDCEYVWNLNSKDSVAIMLEYEKPNIPSIIVLILVIIAGISLAFTYFKSKEE